MCDCPLCQGYGGYGYEGPLAPKTPTIFSAQMRLARDWAELEKNPLAGIEVRPLESHILEWHVSLAPVCGNFVGLNLHLVILFPDNYPNGKPKVRMPTYIPHSNVIPAYKGYGGGDNNLICLDMLDSITGERRYEGWSTAYTVSSLLLQLQSFLFDEFADDMSGVKNVLWQRVLEEGSAMRSAGEVCGKLYKAQKDADNYRRIEIFTPRVF